MLSAFVVLLGTAGPAAALSPSPEPLDDVLLERTAEEFSATEVYAFAEAAGKVALITQAWTPKIQGAASKAVADQYKQTAVSQMQKAILSAGLTMDQYQMIGNAAKRDPLLREEIQQIVDEMY
jgi:hypothetical protein